MAVTTVSPTITRTIIESNELDKPQGWGVQVIAYELEYSHKRKRCTLVSARTLTKPGLITNTSYHMATRETGHLI